MNRLTGIFIILWCSSLSYAQPGNQDIFIYQVDMSYANGTEFNYSTDFFKLDFVNAYQLNPYFSLGAGTSFVYYYDEKDWIVPLFFDLRADLGRKNVKPYVAGNIGYSMDIKKDFSIEGGGLLVGLSTGISYRITKMTSLNIGIGYDMQKAMIFRDWLGDSYPEFLSCFGFNVGFSFRHLKLIF